MAPVPFGKVSATLLCQQAISLVAETCGDASASRGLQSTPTGFS
jgi:hypothetical protein